jgi:hypothetical protein
VNEITPGVFHWTAKRELIGIDVSSYYLAEERVLIDPMLPPSGLEWFAEHGAPEHILLTNRHHDRHAWRLREAFGCVVHCVREGLGELEGRGEVQAFAFGDELPGGVVAHEVDAICPDETALEVPSARAVALADGLVRFDAPYDPPGFVPDSLLGDDPDEVKRGLLDSFQRLLDIDFEHLLLAHGSPLIGDGKERLREFIERAR